MKSAMNRASTCYLAFSRYDDNIKLGILSFNFFFYLTTLRSLMELFMNGTFIFLKNLFPSSLFSFI